jgi:hypothetical protein
MASPAYQRVTSTGAGLHTPMRVDGQDELPFTAAYRSSGRQYRTLFPNEEKENRCRGCVNHTKCVGWTYVLTLFVAATLQPVLLKILLDNLMPYRFPLVVVLCGIHFLVMTVIVAWKYCFGSSTLPPKMCLFSKSHMFCIALLDMLQLLMVVIPGGVVPGTVMLTLTQFGPSVDVVASCMCCRSQNISARYSSKAARFGGAFFVFLGVGAVIYPMVLNVAAPKRGIPDTFQNDSLVLWNSLILLGSSIPAWLSKRAKFGALQRQPMDPYYFNAWLSFCQVLVCIPLSPLLYAYQGWSCTGDGGGNNLVWKVDNMVPNFLDGVFCIFSAQVAEGETCRVGSLLIDPHCSLGFPLVFLLLLISLTLVSVTPMVVQKCETTFIANGAYFAAVPFSYCVLMLYDMYDSTVRTDTTARDVHWMGILGIVFVVLGTVVNQYYVDRRMDETTTSAPRTS